MGKTGPARRWLNLTRSDFENGESMALLQCFLGQSQFDFFAVLILHIHIRFHEGELDRAVDGDGGLLVARVPENEIGVIGVRRCVYNVVDDWILASNEHALAVVDRTCST